MLSLRYRYPGSSSLLPAFFILLLLSHCADASTITPLQTFNQNPLTQIFGLPAAEPARVTPNRRLNLSLNEDAANNYAINVNSRESILLDGESYRSTITLKYGFAPDWEGGVDLPLVGAGGGVFDHFIEDWHSFFHLPEGGRSSSPRNRLLYRYVKDGHEKLRFDESGFGVGDIRIATGWQFYENDGTILSLRSSLKLPTGSSSAMRGSGSTDLALWVSGSSDYHLSGNWGGTSLFASLGGMAMSQGKILADQQRHAAGFGTLGGGWAPTDWIAFTLQLSGNTPLYGNSDLPELANPALQLVIGGTLSFPDRTTLDIGVAEDLAVNTAPDVTLHLRLSHPF